MNQRTKSQLLISLLVMYITSYDTLLGKPGDATRNVANQVLQQAATVPVPPFYVKENRGKSLRAMVVRMYKTWRKRGLSTSYQEDAALHKQLSLLASEVLKLKMGRTKDLKTMAAFDANPGLLRRGGWKIKTTQPANALKHISEWLRDGFYLESELYDVTGRKATYVKGKRIVSPLKRTPDLQQKGVTYQQVLANPDPRQWRGRAEKLLCLAIKLKTTSPNNLGRPRYFSSFLTACNDIRSKIKKSIRSIVKRLLTKGKLLRLKPPDAKLATDKFLATLFILYKKLAGFNVDAMAPSFDKTKLRRKNIKRKIKRVMQQARDYGINTAAKENEIQLALAKAMYPPVELYIIEKEKRLIEKINKLSIFMTKVQPTYLKRQKNTIRKKITAFTDKKVGIASKTLKNLRKDPNLRIAYLKLLNAAFNKNIYLNTKSTNYKKLMRSLERTYEKYVDAYKKLHRYELVLRGAIAKMPGEYSSKQRTLQSTSLIAKLKKKSAQNWINTYQDRKTKIETMYKMVIAAKKQVRYNISVEMTGKVEPLIQQKMTGILDKRDKQKKFTGRLIQINRMVDKGIGKLSEEQIKIDKIKSSVGVQ